MRRTRLFCLLAALHLAVTISLLVFVFGRGMSRFDTGGQPGWFDAACGGLLSFLMFPLSTLLDSKMSQRFPGLWGYLAFAGNSALWAAALTFVVAVVRGIRSRLRATRTG